MAGVANTGNLLKILSILLQLTNFDFNYKRKFRTKTEGIFREIVLLDLSLRFSQVGKTKNLDTRANIFDHF